MFIGIAIDFNREVITEDNNEQMTPQEEAVIKANFEQSIRQQQRKPFIVSVMGQTGVGKSSLLNALFNPRPTLQVGQVRPTTHQVQRIESKNERGHTLIFYDMPGTGESEQFDKALLQDYRKYLLESDVVLWVTHADSRSVTFDAQALKFLIEDEVLEQKSRLMSKITFVLTKADLLVEAPWIMQYLSTSVSFTPAPKTRETLREKMRYYQEKYIEPYGPIIVSRTHHDGNFTIEEPGFKYDQYSVYFEGMLTGNKVDELKQKYPLYAGIFARLYINYCVIPCSAHYKYNLTELMVAIRNKIGLDAHESFKQAVEIDTLDQMPFEQGVKRCNLRIHDPRKQRLVFDLPAGIFPSRDDLPNLHRANEQPNRTPWPLQYLRKRRN